MNQEQLRTLAFNCGAVPYSPPPMRAIRGVSMTYEQLTQFARALGAHIPVPSQCSSLCHPDEPCMLTPDGICPQRSKP
jgi:hypothetical protein